MNNHKDLDSAMKILTDSGLRPGVNLTNEFRELLNDISKRDGLSPEQIINESQVSEVIAKEQVSGPDKLKHIKLILLEMRFPEYTKARQQFKDTLRSLKLHPKIKIDHAPFFEDTKLRVEFSYRDPAELAEITRSLEKLAEVDIVKDALDDKQDIS